MTFKFFNYLSPLYMNDILKMADQNTSATRASLFKLSQPLRETNRGKRSLSYVAHSIWNKMADFLKTTETSIRTNTELKSIFFKE